MTPDPEDLPIRGLADLEQNVSPTFIGIVRRKIHRRTTASQFANFSWSLPKMILIELINLVVNIFPVVNGRKGRSE